MTCFLVSSLFVGAFRVGSVACLCYLRFFSIPLPFVALLAVQHTCMPLLVRFLFELLHFHTMRTVLMGMWMAFIQFVRQDWKGTHVRFGS
ncbi:hypothetical protein P171DRAFT_20369 [Karstenula rhodostoma CBS 690.94]|uniref:Uncharacterized protein n=1 Tax=Karstenula rhodostoma CBS 690.94 TaxID=1392251 RepID=A0A9P4Q0A1_9PLEO|nr:hypothetical protein P171DRAFT_20369 [Karstenula rhodostoma CBS 690.94]